MAIDYEYDPVDFVTVGTIGAPGQRVFHLQAKREGDLLTLIIEKEQAETLSTSITSLLEELDKDLGLETPEPEESQFDFDLQEPILPAFRVAQMGLGYDEENDRLVLIVSELQLEDEPGEPRVARITASRELMRALAVHAKGVVAKGRADPRSNGHRHA